MKGVVKKRNFRHTQADKEVFVELRTLWNPLPRVSNLQPMGHMWPKMALNAAQHKIIHLLKNFFCSSVFISVFVFNVWPKTILLTVWPKDAKSLDTPTVCSVWKNYLFFCLLSGENLFGLCPSSWPWKNNSFRLRRILLIGGVQVSSTILLNDPDERVTCL